MNTWKFYLQNKKYRLSLLISIAFVVATLSLFAQFLNGIESREGTILNDYLLNIVPAKDCSIWVFFCLWSSFALCIYYIATHPKQLLICLWGYGFLAASRILTIALVPLNPPVHIIALNDPITNAFYGGKFMTKDLFYSGHTATVILMYLITEKKWLKCYFLFCSIAIGTMVLVQHIHYTVDVIFAPAGAYLVYRMGLWVAKKAL